MKNGKQKLFNGFCMVLFGAPLKACQGPHNCLLGPHKLCFRTFKGLLGTKMGPFEAWKLLKLCKYYSKVPWGPKSPYWAPERLFWAKKYLKISGFCN